MANQKTPVKPLTFNLGDVNKIAMGQGHCFVVCGESIAVYPPGIPSLLPGERITEAIVAHLREQVEKGARLHGASDPELQTIHVLPDEAVARRHR